MLNIIYPPVFRDPIILWLWVGQKVETMPRRTAQDTNIATLRRQSVGLGTPGPNLALAFPCLSGGLTTHSINILPGPAPAGAAAIVTFAHRGAFLCGVPLKLGSSSFDIGVYFDIHSSLRRHLLAPSLLGHYYKWALKHSLSKQDHNIRDLLQIL